jgi:hypothetical protein
VAIKKQPLVTSIGLPSVIIDQDKGPMIYADRVDVSVQYYDLKLRLHQILRVEDGRAVVREAGILVISPPHARALAELLRTSVDSYEKAFGPITPAPGPNVEMEE